MFSSCEDNPGYDPRDPRDEPEPEEEKEAAMKNEFLRPAIQLLEGLIEFGGPAYLRAVKEALAAIPELASYCPACGYAPDLHREDNAPVPVFPRSCGHVSCDHCARHCADEGCANLVCDDCCSTCEGCGETHCPEHTVAKTYCKHCAPPAVVLEMDRPAYVYED